MDKLEQAVKYFKENEGYARLFKGIKNKYISLGAIKGNVLINKPNIAERQALSGLMKKDYSKNSSISINLKKLQERLDESRFEGINLVDLLKEYFKEEILTKKENIQKHQDELELFWQEILDQNQKTYIYKYLEKCVTEKDKLYQDIKKYYKKDSNILKNELLNACKAINNLPEVVYNEAITVSAFEPVLTRIPVFASRITSNPHGLDKKTLCGKLFILLLCYINEVPYPKNSEDLAELYYKNYLLVDDVSSMVLCRNITAYASGKSIVQDGIEMTSYELHKGLQAFYEYNEPIFLTMYNLSNIGYISEYNKYKKVVINENPAVFMGIIEKCKIKDFPLVCTYGQVKIAGIMLLDMLVKKNYHLYYSGDLDPEGLQIADRLKQRYKENLTLLGFDTDVYFKNMSNVDLNDNRLQKLNSIKCSELASLCDEMKIAKKAAYEEENIDFLVRFIDAQVDEIF